MRVCAGCGTENSEGAKFCNECAAPLTETPPRALEERKVVSVLFCDLVGFTASSEQQDPEDVRARLRPYHSRVRQEIERYGATVEKFVGDAVMAVCGAPAAHEDDAERAVRAGLAILEAIAELNEADPALGLQVRVGINTGEVVVAVDARPEHGEGIVTGDVVNTASRIQTVAPVNAVVVSEATYRATSRMFVYEPLEPVAVKGKTEPLVLWRAVASRGRYGSDVGRSFKTPFVGRVLEKPLLIAAFERAVQQRSVQLVTIVGEPGVGKSRLISELLAYAHAKPEITRWKQGRCLPYGEGITFWALGEIVKAEAGILESDSSESAMRKLEVTLPEGETERGWLLQRLAPLVGVEATSPAERQELFTGWRRYLEALAVTRPSVFVFEDLHWADEALLGFLEYLAEWSQDVPMLLLCAARPELYERRPGWGAGQRNAQTVDLSPLSDQETAQLVTYLAKTNIMSAELERLVLEQAGGNPLYAEEFMRLLADRGAYEHVDRLEGLVVPDTVQSLIAARLDTLTPERKSLLQDAAVIGKVFWAGAIAEISGRNPEQVAGDLHELARKELVRPVRTTSIAGEDEYSFWHVLVRDVAYSQIPRGARARRHLGAAAWIERKAGGRVEDVAEVLAHHYLQALELSHASGSLGEAERLAEPARRFLALAGERALGLDTAQAEALLTRALELATPEDPQWADLVVSLSEAALQGGRLRETAEELDAALAILRERDQAQSIARALQVRSFVALRLGEGRHVALAQEAVSMLARAEPGAALVDAYTQLAHAQSRSGHYRDGLEAADRARALASELGLPEAARALGLRGEARLLLGDQNGLADMERAHALLVEAGAASHAATLQNNLAVYRYFFQGATRSLAELLSAIEFCNQRGLVEAAVLLDSNCPIFLSELGRIDEALECIGRCSPVLESGGLNFALLEPRAVEVAILTARGQQVNHEKVDWVIETARAIGADDTTATAFATAAAALAGEFPDRSRTLLGELGRTDEARRSPFYVRQLPVMMRTAFAAGDEQLARRLATGLDSAYPLNVHAFSSAHAVLLEHEGRLDEAQSTYGEAARGWLEFGNVPERAFALLGQGRCLWALGVEEVTHPLMQARALFEQMGYVPALSETIALLESATAAPAP